MAQFIINKVIKVFDDQENVKIIMEDTNKDSEGKNQRETRISFRIRKACNLAEVNYLDYIDALKISNQGYKVVLQRDVDELFINPFNEEWLRAWDANMDI